MAAFLSTCKCDFRSTPADLDDAPFMYEAMFHIQSRSQQATDSGILNLYQSSASSITAQTVRVGCCGSAHLHLRATFHTMKATAIFKPQATLCARGDDIAGQQQTEH